MLRYEDGIRNIRSFIS